MDAYRRKQDIIRPGSTGFLNRHSPRRGPGPSCGMPEQPPRLYLSNLRPRSGVDRACSTP